MSDAFKRAVTEVLRHEGGYVNDPADRGGETNFGISKRSYPALDIKALTRDDAVALYHRDYWAPLKCDEMPYAVALALFDCAVNQGAGIAPKLLQRAAGVKTDGVIGRETLRAVSGADPDDLLVKFLTQRALRYTTAPTLAAHGKAWFARLFSVHQAALESLA